MTLTHTSIASIYWLTHPECRDSVQASPSAYAHCPLENLDIHLGRPIVLDEGLLFEKIVRSGAAVFCYELNGLFAALLRQLQFPVILLSARVYEAGKPGREFDHMALLFNWKKDGWPM